MQQLDRKEPIGSLSAALGPALQQLAAGLGSQLQQRRQRQHNAMGLQSLGIPEAQANFMSEMDPQLQQISLKQKLLEPSRQANWDLYNQLFSGGNQQSNMQGGNQQQLSSMSTDQQSNVGGMPQAISNQPQPMQQGGMSGGMPRSNLGAKGQMSDNDLRASIQLQTQLQNVAAKKQIAADKNALTERLANLKYKKDKAGLKLKELTGKEKNQIKKEDLGLKKQLEWRSLINPINEGLGTIQAVRGNLAEIRDYYRGGQVISSGTQQALQLAGLDKAITNADTQAVGKASAQMVINQLGRMKGMGQVRQYLAQMVERMKPSVMNTPEGIEAISDSIDIGLNASEKIMNLQKTEYDRIGNNVLKDPYSAPTDPDKFIQPQIDKINKDSIKEIHDVVNKHSTAKYKQEKVEAIDDPGSFDTFKDHMFFYDDDGKPVGSDGTRYRHVELVGGVPTRFID